MRALAAAAVKCIHALLCSASLRPPSARTPRRTARATGRRGLLAGTVAAIGDGRAQLPSIIGRGNAAAARAVGPRARVAGGLSRDCEWLESCRLTSAPSCCKPLVARTDVVERVSRTSSPRSLRCFFYAPWLTAGAKLRLVRMSRMHPPAAAALVGGLGRVRGRSRFFRLSATGQPIEVGRHSQCAPPPV